ncbi:MAG: hypothetical protein M3N98_16615, partial [Actinomycetota bacterium]|nr:hypothetical protein [Actinomycetota bacterium]
MAFLVSVLLSGLLSAGASPAFAWRAQTGPSQAQADALAAQVARGAAHLHQLTARLDQARLQVQSTSAELASSLRQHDQTVAALAVNHAVLRDQAVL